jgi:hypothetical protein
MNLECKCWRRDRDGVTIRRDCQRACECSCHLEHSRSVPPYSPPCPDRPPVYPTKGPKRPFEPQCEDWPSEPNKIRCRVGSDMTRRPR